MFALCDLNKFYASIIRVFKPELEGPIIVLSNNDGCSICYSPGNLKVDLPIEMGTPIFQIEHLVRRYNIQVFSCNFPLIADMSIRVKNILKRFCPVVEDYSIDEVFLDFSGFSVEKIESSCREIVKIIGVGLGLPISVGVGSSKTLAKVACKFAKKYKAYKGVCMIDNEEKREKALQLYPIGDVWGIGRKYEKKLKKRRIITAFDFTRMSAAWVRKEMTVVGLRTQQELLGYSCIPMEEIAPAKKNIMVSRSFGTMIPDYQTIAEALVTYECMGAAKLRKQKTKAKSIYVFLESNPFREDLPQLKRSIVVSMPVPTNSSMEIAKYAKEALKQIFEKGIMYKITGIMMSDISPEDAVQLNLFDPLGNDTRKKHDLLMLVVDRVNNKYGRNTLMLAACGDGKKWWIRQEKLCPCYTTRLSDLLTAS